MADVLGRAVVTSGEAEATSRGAALLALQSLGFVKNLEDAPASTGKVYRPDPGRHERYMQALERQRNLYDLLIVEGRNRLRGFADG